MSSNKLFISYSEKIKGFGFCLQSRIPKWRNKKNVPMNWIVSCVLIVMKFYVNGHVANEGHVTFRKVSEGEVIVIVKN